MTAVYHPEADAPSVKSGEWRSILSGGHQGSHHKPQQPPVMNVASAQATHNLCSNFSATPVVVIARVSFGMILTSYAQQELEVLTFVLVPWHFPCQHALCF